MCLALPHTTPVSSAVSSTSVNHTSPSLTPPVSADADTVKAGEKKEDRNEMQFPIQIKHQTVKSTERKYFFILTNVVPKRPKGQKGEIQHTVTQL